MAKYRPIYLNIWKDPDFERYTPNQKLLFIYLCTNSETTESGIYPITLKTISNETGISLKKVERILSEGLKNIYYDFENFCVFVKNFYRYKGKGNPKLIKKSIENNRRNIKTKLWLEFAKTYPELCSSLETLDKPFNKPLETLDKPLLKVDESGAFKGKGIIKGNSKGNISSSELKKVFDEESVEYKLSSHLFEKMKENNSNVKKPNFQIWAKYIDYMIRIDKRNPDTIKQVINWCQQDSFWYANILSTQKLREKFDKLFLKLKGKPESKGVAGESYKA